MKKVFNNFMNWLLKPIMDPIANAVVDSLRTALKQIDPNIKVNNK